MLVTSDLRQRAAGPIVVNQWKKVYVETIPVARVSTTKQRPIIRVVDRVLDAKAADPADDTAELEAEIDWRVYALYGLTEEEIAAVEGR